MGGGVPPPPQNSFGDRFLLTREVHFMNDAPHRNVFKVGTEAKSHMKPEALCQRHDMTSLGKVMCKTKQKNKKKKKKKKPLVLTL